MDAQGTGKASGTHKSDCWSVPPVREALLSQLSYATNPLRRTAPFSPINRRLSTGERYRIFTVGVAMKLSSPRAPLDGEGPGERFGTATPTSTAQVSTN